MQKLYPWRIPNLYNFTRSLIIPQCRPRRPVRLSQAHLHLRSHYLVRRPFWRYCRVQGYRRLISLIVRRLQVHVYLRRLERNRRLVLVRLLQKYRSIDVRVRLVEVRSI